MITAHHIHTAKKGMFTAMAVWLVFYLFIIMLTYTPNDPSWSHISSDMSKVSNMGGEAGAWFADILYTFFGASAWWLLLFITYEALSLWWQRDTIFGLFRVVAYVFLLLASCGLIAIVSQLLGATQMSSVGQGGILGFEVAYRLAALMKPVGATLFLSVFVFMTVTFAFNIHWRALLRSVFGLILGDSRLRKTSKQQSVAYDTVASGEDSDSLHDTHNLDESELNHQQSSLLRRRPISKLNPDAQFDDESEAASVSPLYGQLDLQLPEQQDTDDDLSHHLQQNNHSPIADTEYQKDSLANDGLENVLNEFLVTSGIGKSLLELQQQEAAQQDQQQQHDSQLHTDPNHASNNNRLGDLPGHKQEPSFAWNDQSVIDDLLQQQAPQSGNDTPQTRITEEDIANSQPLVNNTTLPQSQPPISESSLETMHTQSDLESATEQPAEQAPEPTQTQPLVSTPKVVNPLSLELSNKQQTAESQSDLQHSELSQPTVSDPVDVSNTNIEVRSQSLQEVRPSEASPPVTARVNEVDQAAPQAAPKASTVHQPIAPDEVLDLTPTNTPPSDPTQPPTVAEPMAAEHNTDNTESAVAVQAKASAPSMRFATPEGDASNHIEDMVPEDGNYDNAPNQSDLASIQNSAQATEMPAIHDDAAFSSKSRSMQTAKYRSSLTPIPELSILDKPDPNRKPSYTEEELVQLSELLEIKLQDFNVKAEVMNAIPGPVVTRFEVELAAGVKASKVTGISRDLARSLSMATLRVVEVIPGKPYIGIEIPNKKRAMVRLIELLETEKYKDPKAQISMAMGKDIGGKPIITDLAKAPHMLVAGTTGSGKSVLVNAMLLSILLKYKPSELRLILIDPKQLELANYNDIPHLLTPVVTDMNEAASSLSWCVAEMERRYQLMSLLKVRKLNEFNKKVMAAEAAGNPMIDPLWRPNDSVSIDKAPKLKTLPMIVIVADEFADMIMQVGKQAEELITRLAQKSRAAGIHLMLATQRPSVDVITGLIKANIPVRAALRVNSKVDSRTILDAGGAEDMLGNGDMLFLGPGQIEPDRVHGAYVSDEEVNRVCDAWRERGAPDYIDNMASNFELTSPSGSSGAGNTSGEDDNLYDEAVAFVMETRKVSASSIQRKFSIGYNRAARIVDSMEEAGLVSSMGKSGKRELLM